MEVFFVENPPELNVAKAWHTASKGVIPPIHRQRAAIRVRET